MNFIKRKWLLHKKRKRLIEKAELEAFSSDEFKEEVKQNLLNKTRKVPSAHASKFDKFMGAMGKLANGFGNGSSDFSNKITNAFSLKGPGTQQEQKIVYVQMPNKKQSAKVAVSPEAQPSTFLTTDKVRALLK